MRRRVVCPRSHPASLYMLGALAPAEGSQYRPEGRTLQSPPPEQPLPSQPQRSNPPDPPPNDRFLADPREAPPSGPTKVLWSDHIPFRLTDAREDKIASSSSRYDLGKPDEAPAGWPPEPPPWLMASTRS